MGMQIPVAVSLLVLFSGGGASREWTVLSKDAGNELTRPCSRSFPPGLTGSWPPAAKDLEGAERALPSAIAAAFSALRGGAEKPTPPARYFRQYVGFWRAGKHVLYVNGLGLSAADGDVAQDWREHAQRLCDGGIQSFGAVYEVETGVFDSFQFNGSLLRPPLKPAALASPSPTTVHQP
jgi:hypothetical protein